VAAGSVAAMMLLTCADVVLRYLRRPIPGTYEMVGLLGAVFVSFALAQTSIEKGHIAVEFLVQRLSPGVQVAVDAVNALICTGLFAIISWQSFLYAGKLRRLGEVSMTLQMPIYPFVYGSPSGVAC
jgi:TRAP-type C4-dicarboxylate transport system permease small subunit